MSRFALVSTVVLLSMACASVAAAAGPHDMDCMECHSTHYAKGDYIVGVEPAADTINPATTRTKRTAADIDALCLGCHNDEMGIMPVNLHTTHPTGVKPTYTKVPSELLWSGVFTCVSCHNPHPSNSNYRYLIVSTDGGTGMGVFCGKCHPEQSDPAIRIEARKATITTDPNVAPRVPISSAAPAPAAQ